VVARKADEGGSRGWLSTEDNAARRRLGDAQQDSGLFSTLLGPAQAALPLAPVPFFAPAAFFVPLEELPAPF
jgi:hypothetical protein